MKSVSYNLQEMDTNYVTLVQKQMSERVSISTTVGFWNWDTRLEPTFVPLNLCIAVTLSWSWSGETVARAESSLGTLQNKQLPHTISS